MDKFLYVQGVDKAEAKDLTCVRIQDSEGNIVDYEQITGRPFYDTEIIHHAGSEEKTLLVDGVEEEVLDNIDNIMVKDKFGKTVYYKKDNETT